MERQYKPCSVCGILKPNTKEYFHVHTVQRYTKGVKSTWRGLRPECKICRQSKRRKYHQENKEHSNAKCREYYQIHKDRWKEYRKNKESERLTIFMNELNNRLSRKLNNG